MRDTRANGTKMTSKELRHVRTDQLADLASKGKELEEAMRDLSRSAREYMDEVSDLGFYVPGTEADNPDEFLRFAYLGDIGSAVASISDHAEALCTLDDDEKVDA